jgi:hypothetical protein
MTNKDDNYRFVLSENNFISTHRIVETIGLPDGRISWTRPLVRTLFASNAKGSKGETCTHWECECTSPGGKKTYHANAS